MKNHIFHYARAKNFMCFGEDGIELFFKDYGPIVLIKGVNKDTSTANQMASNGVGKSTTQDVISYALYGKTVKRPKQMSHDRVINEKIGKRLEVEVQFGDYRVLRKREPNSLQVWRSADRLWDDKSEVTRGTMKDTQSFIEGVIGMTHHTFCNVVFFDDSNTYSFLESDTSTKRMIVENLLGLDQYRGYCEIAKDLLKDSKAKVSALLSDYEKSKIHVSQSELRLTNLNGQEKSWKSKKLAEVSELVEKIKNKQSALDALDFAGALKSYNSVQERIATLRSESADWTEKKNEFENNLQVAKNTNEKLKVKKDSLNNAMHGLNLNAKTCDQAIELSERSLEKLSRLADGAKCPVCYGVIDKNNYASVLAHEHAVVDEKNAEVSSLRRSIDQHLNDFKDNQAKIAKIEEIIKKTQLKFNDLEQKLLQNSNMINKLLQVPKPDVDSQQQILEAAINELKSQLESKKQESLGKSPYEDLIDFAIKEREEFILSRDQIAGKMKTMESQIPYYEFWVKAFGDKGIRKFVIDGIIPALNDRVAYWLHKLYNGTISLSFDNELVETITRNGVNAYYPALSNGEKQRVNLAVSQSFAYIMTLNTGSCPSIVFLDEITGGGVDQHGVSGVFDMICELSKSRQVFVTTHNSYLLDMLEGHKEIVLEKENDFTKLV